MQRKILSSFFFFLILSCITGFSVIAQENETINLTDLEPKFKSVGFGELGIGINPFSEDPLVEGEIISVMGTDYPHGLFAHSPSSLVYDLGGKYSSFSGTVMMHDGVQCGDGVLFTIKVDGTLKYSSPAMKSGDNPKTFSIDLSDAQELQLVVVALGNTECDWSIWGDPILTKEPIGKVNSSSNYKIVTRMPTSSVFGQSATKTPTINSTPTVSPILHGVIFREDFDDEDFEPELKWENYNPKKCNFYNKGYMGLVGEPDSLLHNNRQSNLLWYTLPEGEYALTVHLNGIFKLDFQQAAIFLYQDANNYVTINRAYCSLCPPAGNGFYMNYKNAGAFGEYSVRTDKNDVYLRLEKKNNVISGYYAIEPDQWNRLGRFSADYSNFTKAGFGITNDGTVNNALVTLDFFEVSIP